MNLTELFSTFRESAFRLEALQDYVLGEDEPRRRAFGEGRPLPPRPGKTESMRMVGEAVAAGKRVHRVHVVDLPLTGYLRYELAVYPENIASGEEVRIACRDAHPGLAGLRTDFWLFDAETASPAVVWFRYTAAGEIVSRDFSEEPGSVALARGQRDDGGNRPRTAAAARPVVRAGSRRRVTQAAMIARISSLIMTGSGHEGGGQPWPAQ